MKLRLWIIAKATDESQKNQRQMQCATNDRRRVRVAYRRLQTSKKKRQASLREPQTNSGRLQTIIDDYRRDTDETKRL